MLDDLIKVLFVESDEDICRFISETLHSDNFRMKESHDFFFARTGEVAKRSFAEYKPDLVFIDLALPDTPAIQLLEGLHKANPESFIVAMDGNVDKERAIAVKKAGAEGFIVKPFNWQIIDMYLQRCFQEKLERKVMKQLNKRP